MYIHIYVYTYVRYFKTYIYGRSIVYFSFSWPLFHAHQAMTSFKYFHLEQKVKES